MKKVAITAALALVTSGIWVGSGWAGPTRDVKRFCDAVLKVEKEVGAIEEQGPTSEQTDKVNQALARVEETAPAAVATQVTTIVGIFRDSLAAGQDPFANPDLQPNINVVDEYRFTSCGYQQVEVTGRDHAFEGLPKTIKPGTVAFAFTNEGAEIHELAVFRFKGDEKMKELLELSENQARKRIVDVGSTFAVQGETSYGFVKLTKPGRYGAGCFIPVGATSEEAAESAQGPPHAVEGMAVEFRVKK